MYILSISEVYISSSLKSTCFGSDISMDAKVGFFFWLLRISRETKVHYMQE